MKVVQAFSSLCSCCCYYSPACHSTLFLAHSSSSQLDFVHIVLVVVVRTTMALAPFSRECLLLFMQLFSLLFSLLSFSLLSFMLLFMCMFLCLRCVVNSSVVVKQHGQITYLGFCRVENPNPNGWEDGRPCRRLRAHNFSSYRYEIAVY